MGIVDAGALFSDDGKHRLKLWRQWHHAPTIIPGLFGHPTPTPDRGTLCFVGFNPSIAGVEDDPTVAKLVRLAAKLGYSRLEVYNLLTRIATDPADLAGAESLADLLSPEGRKLRLEGMRGADAVVVGWGAIKAPFADLARAEILSDLSEVGVIPWCFGLNKDGSPKHPLYLKETGIVLGWFLP